MGLIMDRIRAITIFFIIIVVPIYIMVSTITAVLAIRSLNIAAQSYIAAGNTSFIGISIDRLQELGFPGLFKFNLWGGPCAVNANSADTNNVDIILTKVPHYAAIAVRKLFKNSANSVNYSNGTLVIVF